MTTDCSKITDEPATPEPFDAADDADWRQPIPHRRDLLSHAQARKDWRCSDADLAGWINSNRVDAYEPINGRLYRFSWLEFPVGADWQARLVKLKYKSASSMADRTRYASYAEAIAILKDAAPGRDTVAILADAAGLTGNELEWELLAISLTGEPLTADSLTHSIYIKEQVKDFALSAFGVRRVYERKEILKMRQSGMSVDSIVALGVPKGQITKLNKEKKIQPLTPGTKPRLAG